MANFKNGIQLSVKLDTKNQVESELNKLISDLNKNKIELNINTNNLKKNLQEAFNLDGITKSAYSSAKVFEKEMDNLADSMAKVREASNKKSNSDYLKSELLQAKAINKTLEDNYKSTLKEANAQKQVQQEIQKQIKLLEIRKQGMVSKDSKVDISDIDKAISKYKQLDNISMKDLRNEISYINAELKNSSTSADSFMSKLGKGLSNIGIYVNAGDIFRGIINSAKDAIQYTIDVENSMIDLRRIVDLSDSSANQFQESMHGVSVSLASSNSDLIETTANFAKLGYSLQDAETLASTSTKYNFSADVGDINNATSTLISTMKAFKIEAKDAMAIGDGINKVSNDFAVSANQINDGLLKSSATLSAFGNDLNESIALISAGTEIIQNGDIVGTALKSSSARLTTNDSALKWLKNFNISLEDQNGNLKSTYKLLDEIAPKLNELQGEQKALAMSEIFGKQNISSMLAIINNIDNMHKVMDDLSDSTGSVDQEFNRYLDSTQAKTTQLKENLGGLYSQFINSNMTKGTVDGLNLFITSITGVISKLGAIPTVITTVVTSFALFNSKFSQSLNNFTSSIPVIGNWINKLNTSKTQLQTVANAQQQQIIKLQEMKAQYQNAGMSTTQFNKSLGALQGQLALTNVKMLACKVGAVALQGAMTMGLSVAVDFVIGKFSDLINTQERVAESNQDFVASLKDNNNLDNTQELLNNYKILETQLSTLKNGTEDYKSKEQELQSVQEQLLSIYPNVNTILDENTGKKKLNADATQSLIDKDKELQKAQANGILSDNGISNLKDIKDQIRIYQEYMDEVKQANEKANNGETKAFGSWGGYASDLSKEAEKYKEELLALQGALSILGDENENYKGALDLINNALTDNTNKTESNTGSKKDNEDATNTLKQAQEELSSSGELSSETLSKLGMSADEAKEAISDLNEESSADNGFANNIEDATKQYIEASQSIKDLKSYIEDLNKAQEMTPELASKIAEKYPDVGNAILDVSDCVDFLNEKIQEQADIQQQAFEIMIGDDENFYQQKIANNSEFQNAYNNFLNSWLSDGQNSYNVDLSNYKTLNELKSASQNGFGQAIESWLSQFVGSSATGYAQDFANFKSFAEAKASVINKLNEALRTMQSNINSNVDAINNATSDMSSGEAEKLYGKNLPKLEKLESAIKDVDTNFDGISGQMQGFSGGSIGTSGVSGSSKGNGGSSGGSKGSSKQSDAEKAEEERQKYMEKLLDLQTSLNVETDRYFEINNSLDWVNAELEQIEQSKELLSGSELADATIRENELKQQQIDLQQQLIDKKKEEASETRALLEENGFMVDGHGQLINTTERLNQMTEKLKATQFDFSEQGIDAFNEQKQKIDDLKSATESYTKMINSEIPSAILQYQKLTSAINEANKTNVENLRNTLAGYIKEDLQKELENTISDFEKAEENDISDLEEEKQSMIDSYDKKIASLREELNALNDDSEDKQKKLAKLQNELKMWQNDNSVYSKFQQQELNTQIADLQKDIRKDELNSQIEDLEEQRDNESDDYDERIDSLNDYYDKKKKIQQDANDDALLEEKAYAKADKLLKEQNVSEIEEIMSSHAENFKDIGSLLGTNFSEALTLEIQTALDSLDQLLKKYDIDTETNSSSNSSNGIDLGTGATFYPNSSSNKSSSSNTSSNGIDLGTGATFYPARYASGGETPKNMDKNGEWAILDGGEKVLNRDENKNLKDVYSVVDKVMDSLPILDEIKNMANDINISGITMPSYVPMNYNPVNGISDLNKLVSTTNNNDNSNKVEINNEFNITNEKQVQADRMPNNISKLLQNEARSYGLRKR